MRRWVVALVLALIVLLTAGCQGAGRRDGSHVFDHRAISQVAATASPSPPSSGLVAVPITNPPRVTGLPYPKSCHINGKLPDRSCTPGAVNPAVTQATILQTICVSRWTRTVRPPTADTGAAKTKAMIAYGLDPSTRATNEGDHLVSIELGGTNDRLNFWSEPSDIPGAGFRNTKDQVENTLRAAVCPAKDPSKPHKRVLLVDAQRAIAHDWTTALQVLGLK